MSLPSAQKRVETIRYQIAEREQTLSSGHHSEYLKCREDPIYFAATYCMIQDLRNQRPIPFKLYPCQETVFRAFLSSKRLAVLKSRQLGLTTLSGVYALWLAMFHPQQFVLIVSIKQETSTEFLDRLKFTFDLLPDFLRPPVLKRTESTLWFGIASTDERGSLRVTGLNSQIKSIPTSREAGRSKTLSLLILDEAAFVENADLVWRAAEPTLEQSKGQAILVSTANGMGGWFYNLWTRAKRGENDFRPVFLSWTEHPDRDAAWYERKVREASRIEDVWQEHPSSDQEAFVSSGRPFFSQQALAAYLDRSKPPECTGTLEMSEDGKGIRLVEDPKGWLRVWKRPVKGRRYSIGADPSEGAGGDYSSAHVMDIDSFEVVAELHGHMDPDVFAFHLSMLGHWYERAFLGCERNGSGLSVLTVLRQGHPNRGTEPYLNLYFEETVDHVTNKPQKRFGWLTSMKTRPLILDDLARAVREGDLKLWSREVVEECVSFLINTSGRPEAVQGAHDDRVMSLAITLKMRESYGRGRMYPTFDGTCIY